MNLITAREAEGDASYQQGLGCRGRRPSGVGGGRGCAVIQVALVSDDYPGLEAKLAVAEGEGVARGQLLFEDRSTPGVRYTAPAAGRVVAIHRGDRRVLRSVVIELSPGERSGRPETARLSSYRGCRPADLAAEEVRALLLESGLWTALRTRPFNRVPAPGSVPRAVFVNGMDTEPLAPDPVALIRADADDFRSGLSLLGRLSAGPTYLCLAAEAELGFEVDPGVTVERFSGPHPAGTTGLHVHRLFPVGRERSVWTVGYQDVIAAGALARSGVLPVERTIALAGPAIREPRLLRARLGASVSELVGGELDRDDALTISGSALSGRSAVDPEVAFLGRYHRQISALPKQPALRSLHSGGPILPIGRYERVFPFDILSSFLLRALAGGDLESAEELGCLELAEEDLALCSYVCPARNDYSTMLRRVLDRIHAEWGAEDDVRSS